MALSERYAGATLSSVLAHRAADAAEAPFLVHDGQTTSYGEVDSQAEALAASLAGFGIDAGDRVALVLPPCLEFVVGLFAVARLGAVVVPLSPDLTQAELQYGLRHSECVAAITIETYGGVDFLQRFETLMSTLPELQYLVTVGEEDLWYDDRIFQFEDLLSAGIGRNFAGPDDAGDPDAPFALVYTAGTTGKPKGVGLSHRNLVYAAAGTADVLGLAPGDRVVGLTALNHAFALGPGILGCLASGAALVLTDADDAGLILDTVEALGVTVLYGIPTLFVRSMREQEARPRNLSSLRIGLVAGAPVPDGLVARVEAELCPTLLSAYSLTETASVLALTRPGDAPSVRQATVGRPLPGTRVRVLEEGDALPVESVGDLAVEGPGLMAGGYYRQPRDTRNRLDTDGFFRTGDLGMVDEDGNLHLVGRREEVIIRTGFNVYPREVEDRLRSHPAVDEVAVVGVPDAVLGETICACVVPVEGAIVDESDLRSWCRETLADGKVPDRVRLLDRFPRSASGQVRRVELVRWLRETVDSSPPGSSQAP
ncbi:MAG: AMP-binding protein [Gemmatimonadetes bacterium]|nr:AMP-binding protein [Gemmatimonadota bacterium]